MYTENGYQHHKEQIDKSYGYQIFPFKVQELVDTQTGECHLNHMMINITTAVLPKNQTTEGI